jgi:hypothetical protein
MMASPNTGFIRLSGIFNVRKAYGDLLAFAFQGTAGGEDLLGQVLRGVGQGLNVLRCGYWYR